MHVAVIVGAAVIGALAGWASVRDLRTLSYRRPDERDLPTPNWHRWLPAITGTGAALVATTSSWERLILAAPLLTIGVWLASVDADVKRLPYRQVITLTVVQAFAVAGVTLATQNLRGALVALLAAVLAYLAFRVLHHFARGDLGYGDVTLAPPLALAVTTAGGPALAWAWLVISLTAAAIHGLATRSGPPHRPLGPWLIAGAIVIMGFPG